MSNQGSTSLFKQRLNKYNPEWENVSNFKEWLRPLKKLCYRAYCTACRKTFSISHGGIGQVRTHGAGKRHNLKLQAAAQRKYRKGQRNKCKLEAAAKNSTEAERTSVSTQGPSGSLPVSARDEPTQEERGNNDQTIFYSTFPYNNAPSIASLAKKALVGGRNSPVKDKPTQVENGRSEQTVFSPTLPSNHSSSTAPVSLVPFAEGRSLPISAKGKPTQIEQGGKEQTVFSPTLYYTSASSTALPQSVPSVAQSRGVPLYQSTQGINQVPKKIVTLIQGKKDTPEKSNPIQVEQGRNGQTVFTPTLSCTSASSTASPQSVSSVAQSRAVPLNQSTQGINQVQKKIVTLIQVKKDTPKKSNPIQVEQGRKGQTVFTPTHSRTSASSTASPRSVPSVAQSREVPLNQSTQGINQVQTETVTLTGAKKCTTDKSSPAVDKSAKDEYDTFGAFVAEEFRTLKSDAARKWLKRAFLNAIVKASEADETEETHPQSNPGFQHTQSNLTGFQQTQASHQGSWELQSQYIDSRSMSASNLRESPSPSIPTSGHHSVPWQSDRSRTTTTTTTQELSGSIFYPEADVIEVKEEELSSTPDSEEEIEQSAWSPDSSNIEVNIGEEDPIHKANKKRIQCNTRGTESSQAHLSTPKDKTQEMSTEEGELSEKDCAMTFQKRPKMIRTLTLHSFH